MCTIRATVYLLNGESTTVFIKTDTPYIDLEKSYEAYCIYSARVIQVKGDQLSNPDVIFKS